MARSPVSHSRAPIVVPAALLLVQVPAKIPGKANDGLRIWAPATCLEDLNGIPNPWPWLGPAKCSLLLAFWG